MSRQEKDLYKVGWIKDAHGIRGEIYIRFESENTDWASELKVLNIQLKTEKEINSYDIQKMKPHKEGFIVKLAGIEDRNRAEEIKGSSLYIPSDLLVTESQTDFYLKEILNFKVYIDSEDINGQVVGFSSNTVQSLAVIKTNKGSYEVPLVDEFIEQIDYKEQKIFLKIPEGLVEWE